MIPATVSLNVKEKKAVEYYLNRIELVKNGAVDNPFETAEEQEIRKQRAKKDVEFFITHYLSHWNFSKSADFHIALAKKVKRNKNCKILVRWGRGLAKSVWCDVIIPLWLWINEEDIYLVLVGNNQDKAEILLADLMAEFTSNQRLIHDFGDQRVSGNWEDSYFVCKQRFIAKAIGMGVSPRGLRMRNKRPNMIVCDDLEDRETVKNPKRQSEIADWILKDLIPTMDDGARRFLMPNNYFYPVTIQSILEELRPNWETDRVDAYDPVTLEPRWKEKYKPSHYADIIDEIGILATEAEYNNCPHVEGKIFKREQINWAKLPYLNSFDCICGHWDIAYAGTEKADYNAVRIWGIKENRFWYIASFVRQTKMKAALLWMADFQNDLPATVSIHWRFESQFWNDEVQRTIAEVEEEKKCRLNLVKVDTPKKKKYDRIISLQPYYQNSRIYYNEQMKGDNDTQTGIVQLLAIEPGYRTHDDAPDADQQCLDYLSKFSIKRNFKPVTGKFFKNLKRSYL